MMSALIALWTFFQGKKTYLVAILGAILAVIQAPPFNYVVPPLVMQLLAALGLVTLRAGISHEVAKTSLVGRRF